MQLKSDHPRYAACVASVLSGALSAGSAWADDPSSSEATEAPTVSEAHALPAPTAEMQGPLHVEIEQQGFDLEPEVVRQALTRELGLPLTTDSAAAAVHVRVVAEKGAAVAVSYQGAEGERRKRSVAAPGRADEVAAVAALLAGNLARNYSEALIERLQKRASANAASREGASTEGASVQERSGAGEGQTAAAPTPSSDAAERATPAEVALKDSFFNLSVVAPLAIFPDAEQRRFAFELGMFYSRVGGISGVGLNGVALRTEHASEGVMLSGMLSLHHGPVGGATIAGAVNLAPQQPADGLQLAGAVNVAGSVGGAQLGGAVNVAGPVSGAQLAGAVNVASEYEGAQLAGAVNVSRRSDGAQIAGAVNVADEGASGLQLGVVNIAGAVRGAQVSVVNIGGDVEGLQLGVINVAKSVKGASVGCQGRSN